MNCCIWCGEKCENLVKNKYCHSCQSKCVRECKTCHKPYPSLRFFKLNEKRCNSCHTRYLRHRTKQMALANMKRKKEVPSFPSVLLLKKFAEERERFRKRQQAVVEKEWKKE